MEMGIRKSDRNWTAGLHCGCIFLTHSQMESTNLWYKKGQAPKTKPPISRGRFQLISPKWLDKPRVINHNPASGCRETLDYVFLDCLQKVEQPGVSSARGAQIGPRKEAEGSKGHHNPLRGPSKCMSNKWLWLKHMYQNAALGKWNQRRKPAVCPSSLSLSHSQMSIPMNVQVVLVWSQKGKPNTGAAPRVVPRPPLDLRDRGKEKHPQR